MMAPVVPHNIFLAFGVVLSPAQKKLIEGFRRLMPNYRFGMSYFGKKRLSSDEIRMRALSSSTGSPAVSRSAKTE